MRAYLRDTRVLIGQFRLTLFLFTFLLLLGTLTLRLTYAPDRPLGWGRALHIALSLMFFEIPADYPDHLLAQVVFLLWPILGIVLVANGVVRFGTALFSRQERREAWQMAVASSYRNHIVVCGLGKVGYRVVLQLLQMQYEVVGVERNREAPFLGRIYEEKVPVLIGDARDRSLLEKAGARVASAVVACTEDDLTNLEIALEARELNPAVKIVMRMFDQQLAERVRRGFGIHTAFSTSALAAPALAAAATRAAIEHSLYVGDVLLNISRITIAAGSPLVGKRVGEVEQGLDLSIILHQGQRGMDYHPAPDLALEEGDQIVVFATLDALACLNRMNEGEEPCPPRGWLDRLRRGKRQR